jgi:hypothetical protein
MGQLTPGVSYVYEHVNGVTYAREHGAPVNTRFEIGRTYERTKLDKELAREILWKDIHRTAESNEALQKALDRCIILYNLIKENGNKEKA